VIVFVLQVISLVLQIVKIIVEILIKLGVLKG